ncbi:Eco57I restriction-modification methylase domain-containing protein [Lysinibacillus fusiformis]|uniref:Eco57I restriction-modification methylase domain-containing protein n=1 Tax=Lysinibacillus fusiformis TaxID=28031 RepID=UPI00164267E2|nr:TaqI-like C-terminal specificity domain-containing protein [Lysinibacillus fusiformis]
MHTHIFNRKYLNGELSKFELNVIPNIASHLETIKKWKMSLESKNLEKTKEVSVQGLFLTQIFGNILGYNDMISGPEWNMIIEKKTQFDSTIADAALGFYTSKTDDTKAVIELKDAKTELDSKQNRKNPQSPVEQAFSYQIKHRDCRWIIVSNIREIRLYNAKTMTAYEKFIVENLTEENEFKRFYFLLHKERLIAKNREQSTIDTLYANNDIEETQITNEFYKYYKNIRINLHKHLIQHNTGENEILLLEKTQKILDRLIFIRFCEDSKFLPKKLFKKIMDAANESFSRSDEKIWPRLKDLFESIDKGNERKQINRFNGGLFKTDEMLDALIIKDFIFEDIEKILNYDFESEVDVNLLGHIFEQSISDLEEIRSELSNVKNDKNKSKRKQDGVFYTPQFITNFLVSSVIEDWIFDKRIELGEEYLPELTDADFKEYGKKLGNNRIKKKTNVEIHIDYYEKLQDAIRNIQILDPACGSGAFLNAAYDYLHVVSLEINRKLENLSGTKSFFDLDNHILRHNLFGVDLNNESVEITKLSLWIKTANAYEPLTALDENIKFGNSIVNDSTYSSNAFIWEREFDNVFNFGGFDIILGNPPYVFAREKISQLEKEYYTETYTSAQYQINTFPIFIEKSINLLKPNGKLGFIVPDTLLKLSTLSELRKFMLEQGSLDTIVQLFGKSFEDAGVETVAFIYNKGGDSKITKSLSLFNASDFNGKFHLIDNSNWINDDQSRFQVTITSESEKILKKMAENSSYLEEMFDVKSGLIAYEKNKGLPKQTPIDVENRPYDYNYQYDESTLKYLEGKNIKNLTVNWNGKWLKYGENLAAPRTLDIFSRPRILIREITAEFPNSFISAFSDELYLNNRSIINVLHENDNIDDLKFLLGILNSELMSYYFIKTNPKSERKLFPKLILADFKKFPIRDSENKATMVNLVTKLSECYSELNEKVSVFETRLMNRFEIKKINKKLEVFYELDFKSFCAELMKLKVKLTLEEEDEWDNYFNKYKNLILSLKKEIEALYINLNNSVYELYEITSEEVNFIRNEMST